RLSPKKRCRLALVVDVHRAVALVHESKFDERLAAQLDLGRNNRALRAGRDGRAEWIQETLIGARVTCAHDCFTKTERLRQLKPVSVAIVRIVAAGAQQIAARRYVPLTHRPRELQAPAMRQFLFAV